LFAQNLPLRGIQYVLVSGNVAGFAPGSNNMCPGWVLHRARASSCYSLEWYH